MKGNVRDLIVLSEAVVHCEKGQHPYFPPSGGVTAARRLVKAGLLMTPNNGDSFAPTERGFAVSAFLSDILYKVP